MLLLAELARSDVTVALSGDGGDELFGGYQRYGWTERRWSALASLPRPVRFTAGEMLSGIGRRRPLLRAAGRGVGRVSSVAGALLRSTTLDEAYDVAVSDWSDVDRLVREARVPVAVREPVAPSRSPLDRMRAIDMTMYLPDDILVKLDRATMSCGLESRVPLLAPEVVRFAWELPSHALVRQGTTKWLLRQVLHRHVPEALIARPKMGFGAPIASWLRGPLRSWGDELLAPSRLAEQGYFDTDVVARLWAQHRSGRADWERPLWTILMFQAWRESEGGGSPPPRRRQP
jgi:asparagine synthase (glutamine-hydrolysing)